MIVFSSFNFNFNFAFSSSGSLAVQYPERVLVELCYTRTPLWNGQLPTFEGFGPIASRVLPFTLAALGDGTAKVKHGSPVSTGSPMLCLGDIECAISMPAYPCTRTSKPAASGGYHSVLIGIMRLM